MATKEKIYRRLPGRGTNFYQYFRLYQGQDHLLLVISSGYYENYKRFFYRDIQSITLEKTGVRDLWTAVWAFLFFVFATFTVFNSGPEAVVLGVMAAVFMGLLLGNLALGPTCKCHIKTAVQTEHLPNFRRLRPTRKVLARIEALIQSAQGDLSPEALQQQWQQALYAASGSAYAPPVVEHLDPLPAPAPVQPPPETSQG
jgi:hypothetical protein